MGRRNVPLGNRDKACEPRLRRQQIVTTRVEAVIGNAVADREEFARGIEEKAKVHRVEHRLRELDESRKAANQRSRGCGRTRETLDDRIDSCQGFPLCGAVGRQARAESREFVMALSQRSGVSARVGSERKIRAIVARKPNLVPGLVARFMAGLAKDKPRPGNRRVEIACMTFDGPRRTASAQATNSSSALSPRSAVSVRAMSAIV